MASLLPTVTAAATLAFAATGCMFSGSASVGTDPISGPAEASAPVATDTTPAVASISIDAGATMSAEPGTGVGVFVEYQAGGFWTVFTTCDTEISGAACDFDILAYGLDPATFIDQVQGFDLGSADALSLADDGSISLVAQTSFRMNGFTFEADPGAAIELDVLVDGAAQPRFVYAVSGGSLLEGVPTNPADFTPASP
jgi:hypothetical protein